MVISSVSKLATVALTSSAGAAHQGCRSLDCSRARFASVALLLWEKLNDSTTMKLSSLKARHSPCGEPKNQSRCPSLTRFVSKYRALCGFGSDLIGTTSTIFSP